MTGSGQLGERIGRLFDFTYVNRDNSSKLNWFDGACLARDDPCEAYILSLVGSYVMPTLYVGNLSFKASEDDLRDAFSAHGRVNSVNIILDRETGRSRGFAFVEMPDGEEAKQAIEEMHETEILGRPVTVNEARPRQERPPRR